MDRALKIQEHLSRGLASVDVQKLEGVDIVIGRDGEKWIHTERVENKVRSMRLGFSLFVLVWVVIASCNTRNQSNNLESNDTPIEVIPDSLFKYFGKKNINEASHAIFDQLSQKCCETCAG